MQIKRKIFSILMNDKRPILITLYGYASILFSIFLFYVTPSGFQMVWRTEKSVSEILLFLTVALVYTSLVVLTGLGFIIGKNWARYTYMAYWVACILMMFIARLSVSIPTNIAHNLILFAPLLVFVLTSYLYLFKKKNVISFFTKN